MNRPPANWRTLRFLGLAIPMAILLSSCMTTSSTSPPPNTASGSQSVTSSSWRHFTTTPVIDDGRFVRPFQLDAGGLLVTPAPQSYAFARSLGVATEQAWSTSEIAGYQPFIVGLGIVTVRKGTHVKWISRPEVAWVALAYASPGSYSCPAEIPPYRHLSAPSSGWAVVVIGDRIGSPDYTYKAASVICNFLQPTQVLGADETVSTKWALTSSSVVTQVPACSTFATSEFGSTRTSTSFRYEVSMPISRSSLVEPDSRSIPACLPGSRTRLVNLDANAQAGGVDSTTVHEEVGLTSVVSTVPYQPPSSGP